jgi:hypothetical protein
VLEDGHTVLHFDADPLCFVTGVAVQIGVAAGGARTLISEK